MTDVKKIFDENIPPINFKEWGYNKTLREILDTCDREDWLLWLLSKVIDINGRQFIKIKAYCANEIKYLIHTSDVLVCIQAAIEYGNNNISYEEYDEIRENAKIAQKILSEEALSFNEPEYISYCIQSMASRWIYDRDEYGMYRGSVELHSIVYKSIPFSEILPILLEIIKTNTKDLI
jgi:hypothetical protein